VVVIRLVEKNQNYIMDITGMTHEGQGVGKVNGFTVFVEGAIEGESVEVKIIKVAKNYGVGKLVNILKPSGERTSPFCKVYKRCGGCSLQHADYGYQLRFKTDVVRESLKRIGKLEDVTVHPTIGMQEPFRYRNKAQYPIAQINGKPAIGLYARRSHDVVEFEECSIQDVISDRVRSIVREFIADNRISIHNESSGKGIIRHVMTRIGFKTGEVMVVIVINGNDLPARQDLIDRLISNVKGIKSIILNINTKNTNVVLGEKNKTIYGDDTINDYIGKYVFKISALSFFQVNPVQTEILYNKALEYAALTGNETVFDLYSGIGTISLFLSEHAGKVYGVELVEDAVRDARRNAEENGIRNVEFVHGEAEKLIAEMYDRGIKADVVVVDPPRKGCDVRLLETLVTMQPKRIVYVSCNPSTLARDLGYLSERGYKALEAQPVDMFPWTAHVECVTLMSRVKK
jgi:23S rRNA (uracil1939-C5)-methyltransferase